MPAERILNQQRRAILINDPAAKAGSAGQGVGGTVGEVISEITGGFVVDAPLTTYSVATGPFTPAATPTDMLTITPGSKTVRITRIRVSGIASTAAAIDIAVVKRSTWDTAGTSTTQTIVPHWSADPAASAVVTLYSANPTRGTLVGRYADDQLFLAGGTQFGFPVVWEFFNTGRALILPAGSTTETIAVTAAPSGAGPTLGGGTMLNVTLQFSEDN